MKANWIQLDMGEVIHFDHIYHICLTAAHSITLFKAPPVINIDIFEYSIFSEVRTLWECTERFKYVSISGF